MDCVESNLVDIRARTIRGVRLSFDGGIIRSIEPVERASTFATYLLPGFVDAHVHIESSMLTPAQFARTALTHGTIATVSDPHEIANVLGRRGIEFMLRDAERVPFKFWFGAPSCVPATSFESAGSALDSAETRQLLDDPDIHYLAEMMNYPGVLSGDPEVLAKIEAARQRGVPIDGHAPGVRGDDARRYFAAGITTDHECFTEAEAVEKLELGVRVQIREGSAARNFDALFKLIDRYPGRMMFCSDDKHPDDLLRGHINQLCRRAVAGGCDPFHVLHAACVAPVDHYQMPLGQLRIGDPADFIEIDSLQEFNVLRTFVDGRCVAQDGISHLDVTPTSPINHFHCTPKTVDQFAVVPVPGKSIRAIVAVDRLLTTQSEIVQPKIVAGNVVSDPGRDLLKLVVVNRYRDAAPSIGFVKSFGFVRGAIASSVAHDSHNVIAVGASDREICDAVNAVIDNQGGLAVVDGTTTRTLPLPVAGLMSPLPCEDVARAYEELDRMAKQLGCPLQAPFMTLSFLALLVIPSLKLSDRGLFDGDQFQFTELFV